MTTRWWLSRGPRGLVFLHLSEVGGRGRGYCVTVADRRVAREYLPILRAHLAEAIERQDRPVRTFDPALDTEGARQALNTFMDSPSGDA